MLDSSFTVSKRNVRVGQPESIPPEAGRGTFWTQRLRRVSFPLAYNRLVEEQVRREDIPFMAARA